METAGSSTSDSPVKAGKVNAFQLLMSSRNKSLGTNCDGKKSLPREARVEDEQKTTRKDQLKKWADEKGAAKRKRDYAARGEVIDLKLEERAKRLKGMLKVEETQLNKEPRNRKKKNNIVHNKKTINSSKKLNQISSATNSKDSTEEQKPNGEERKNDQDCAEVPSEDCTEENKKYVEKSDCSDESEDSDKDPREKTEESFTKKSWKMRIKLKLSDDFQCFKTSVKEDDETEKDESEKSVSGEKTKIAAIEDAEEAEDQVMEEIKRPKNDENIDIVINVKLINSDGLKKELEGRNASDEATVAVAETPDSSAETGENTNEAESKTETKEVVAEVEASVTLDSSDESSDKIGDKAENESATESNDEGVVRSRRSKPAVLISSDESSKENIQIEEQPKENSSTGRVLRPRRPKPAILVELCSTDDEDFEMDSSKKAKTPKKAKEKPKKIAPVFQRAQQLNPEVVEARRAFLLSGMPDCIQLRTDTEKPGNSCGDLPSGYTEFHLEYPEITSVPQAVFDLPKVDLNLPPFERVTPAVLPCKNCIFLQQKSPKHEAGSSNARENGLKIDKDVEIAVLKESNPDMPVERFFKYAKQMHKQGDETQIWTDKYQATKVKHLLKNYDSISMLSDWLKNFNERRKQKGSSESDFLVSDGEDDANGGLTGNSVVLTGPSGCGKSNALYAVCTDLGLDVVEVNASSKRTGKWLLHELQEATQSHQLNKKGAATLTDNGWLDSKSTTAGKSKKEEREKAKNEKKKKKTDKNKMCVLFVEDVDIIFDQDDGFVAALKEIVSNSKRPVVMTTTDEHSPNVQKLMWKSIRFQASSVELLSIWLKVICIVEDLHADLESLRELLKFNKRDLRRTILDLQTWAGPVNPDHFKRVENVELLYWNFPKILRTDDDGPRNDKTKLKKLCDLYDAVILADGILKRTHESLERPFRHPKDSLVLEENFQLYHDRLFDEELARSVIESGLKNYGVECLDLSPISEEGWRSKRRSMEILDEVVRPSTCYAARNLDYMACLCAIAKSEKKRAAANRSKRRFDHFFCSHLDLNRQNNWDSVCDILNKEK